MTLQAFKAVVENLQNPAMFQLAQIFTSTDSLFIFHRIIVHVHVFFCCCCT